MSKYECYCDKCDVPDSVKYHYKKKKCVDERYLYHTFIYAILDKKYACVDNICQEECCNIPNNVASTIALNKDVDGLKFLRSRKMKFGKNVLNAAIDVDNVDCVKYLQSQKCKWTSASTKYAAKYGRIKTLMYMIEQGCPSDEEACYWAAKNRHWDCVQCLCDNGCLFNILHTTSNDLENDEDEHTDSNDD